METKVVVIPLEYAHPLVDLGDNLGLTVDFTSVAAAARNSSRFGATWWSGCLDFFEEFFHLNLHLCHDLGQLVETSCILTAILQDVSVSAPPVSGCVCVCVCVDIIHTPNRNTRGMNIEKHMAINVLGECITGIYKATTTAKPRPDIPQQVCFST